MISPGWLLICVVVAPLLILAGCASSSSQAGANPSLTPVAETGSVTTYGGPDSDHTKVDAANNQIYQAEHASDPDAANVSNAQNQGIP
jgi:hypothetical protein